MPLTKIDTVGEGVRLALWQITESVAQLPVPQYIDLSGIHSENRIKEELVICQLLQVLTCRDDLQINHEPSGKPVVDGYQISLSHTRGWAAMILAEDDGVGRSVGIDIEYYSDRVNKVADRFIRQDEQNDSLSHRLINWSAKETVYKLFSEEDLQYFDMRLHPFQPRPEGVVIVDDLKDEKSVSVNYTFSKEYVLSWAIFYNFFNKIKQK